MDGVGGSDVDVVEVEVEVEVVVVVVVIRVHGRLVVLWKGGKEREGWIKEES